VNKANLSIAITTEDFKSGKDMFLEYSKKLDFDLCFQNFEEELKDIDIQYAKPHGALILLKEENEYIGCVGIRKFAKGIAELKRMYVKEEQRGKGFGKLLLNKAVESAKSLNYEKVRLDTLQTMKEAISLYKKNGFKNIAPYRKNPIEGAEYLELTI